MDDGDGCVNVEELKIINGGHDWPSPLSFWANQDINANVEGGILCPNMK